MELPVNLVVSIVIQLVGIGVFAGIMKTSVSYIEKTLVRLERKQDLHNGLIERMVKVEESTKSAHHRLDGVQKEKTA
jgi:hypothetical protein